MKLRNVGFVSVVVGFILMLATTPVITGFVILENFQGSLIIRLVSIILMIGGVVLLTSVRGKQGGLEEEIDSDKDYYRKRVKEIFNPKYAGQDIYVSRWELNGIMDFVKNGKDYEGNLIYSKNEFEHGTDTVSIHPLGKHDIPHMNVLVKPNDKLGHSSRYKIHLLITNDPYDSRLKNLGIDKTSGKRDKSSVYFPDHPRSRERYLENAISITHEKYKLESKD